MALSRDTSAAQIALTIEGGEPDQFLVLRYSGSEGLCRLFRFELELASDSEAVPFDTVVGKAAVLSVNTDYGTRYFHGLISQLEMTNQTENYVYYRATLVPDFWLLTHRSNCKIFQNKSVPEIIMEVLDKAGIPEDRVESHLTGSYDSREYIVQYRETDYNFISRLMEDVGIFWYFKQSEKGHNLVLVDNPAAYADGPTLPYVEASGLTDNVEHVYEMRVGQCVRPGAVVLTDFWFEKPALNLESKADMGRDTALQFFDYPGEHTTSKKGTDRASMRAQEFETARISGLGMCNSPAIAVGGKFTLSEHRQETMNAEYFVTALVHRGRQAITDAINRAAAAVKPLQLSNRLRSQWHYHAGQVNANGAINAAIHGGDPFDALPLPDLLDEFGESGAIGEEAPVYDVKFECIPSAVHFRPPRVTPWPEVRGTQTARVVGPKGEEIHCDKYGRVKVQFCWDRDGEFDEKSSCWIRVCHGMAGGQYGMMFLPRVGQEVLVDFINGNPDQPIIVGRVYNADHMPPYALPDHKTRSTIKTHTSKGGGGSNEIRFEDLKDSEQLLLHAQKNMHVRVKADKVEAVGNDSHLKIKKNRKSKIEENDHKEVVKNEVTKVGGDQSEDVGGSVSIAVGGTRSLKVTKDVVEKFAAGHKHEVSQVYALKAQSVKIEATSGIELKCGGSSIVLTPAAIFIVGGPIVNINSGSGPPVAPVTASATSPESPEEPDDADTVEIGSDTVYSGGSEGPPPMEVASSEGETFEGQEDEDEETTYIDLKLVDAEGNPCAGEKYRVVDSKGKVHEGALDANGEAHVIVAVGKCDITYPNLDASAWKRT